MNSESSPFRPAPRDQAWSLRTLASAVHGADDARPAPLRIVVAGMDDWTGPLFDRLAGALCATGWRPLLVDLTERVACAAPPDDEPRRVDFQWLLHAPPPAELAAGGGALLAENARPAALSATAAAHERVLRQLDRWGTHLDVALFHLGGAAGEPARRWWGSAGGIVLVGSVDDRALMDLYGLCKRLLVGSSPTAVYVTLLADDEASARAAHRRVDQACRRFLSRTIRWGGWFAGVASLPLADLCQQLTQLAEEDP